MAFRNPFKNFSIGKIFTFLIALLIISQIVSLFISSIFKDVPTLKTGNLLILVSVGLTLIILATFVFKADFKRSDFLALLLVGGITVLMYVYGGQFFPDIFSFIGGDNLLQSAQSLQSTLGLP